MGTGRTEVHRGPCHCGKGEFLIEWCEPDHPSVKPGEGQWESSIECAECDDRYAIVERGRRFVLVETVHLERRRNLENELSERRKRFMDRADVRALLQQFEDKLESFRYKAEIFRFLQHHGFYTGGSQATFTKNWSNANKWVRDYIFFPAHVLKAAGALGADTAAFENDIREFERIEADVTAPLPTIGDSIYESRRA